MRLIETIKNLCDQSEESAMETLRKIKAAIQDESRPDFSKIKDGERFIYRDFEFIRLGLEQGGVLCITAKAIGEFEFDKDACNDWRKSSARKLLNSDFLAELNPDDLLPYESDLTADNGDTAYGKCVDKVGILSCDLYRKYRKFVPLYNEWMWTCTPCHCGTPYSGDAYHTRLVRTDGTLSNYGANIAIGLAPACIFKVKNKETAKDLIDRTKLISELEKSLCNKPDGTNVYAAAYNAVMKCAITIVKKFPCIDQQFMNCDEDRGDESKDTN